MDFYKYSELTFYYTYIHFGPDQFRNVTVVDHPPEKHLFVP